MFQQWQHQASHRFTIHEDHGVDAAGQCGLDSTAQFGRIASRLAERDGPLCVDAADAFCGQSRIGQYVLGAANGVKARRRLQQGDGNACILGAEDVAALQVGAREPGQCKFLIGGHEPIMDG